MARLGARLRPDVAGKFALCMGLMAAFALALSAAPAQAARNITRAITDDAWYDASGTQWVPRTVSSGAKMVLLEVDWANIEQSPGQYSFAGLDSVVSKFEGTPVSLGFLVTDAPSWAQASGVPAALVGHGAWKPNPQAYAQFATTLARRYNGSTPDPLNPGRSLPHVRYYQAWAEANFTIHLAPQWTKTGGRWVATGPTIYRGLLNAFYAAVKSVNSSNFVIATGLGPYGDNGTGTCPNAMIGPGCRMHPAAFTRALLCVSTQLRRLPCPTKARFDALAADPYDVGSPTTKPYNADDISVPDLGKLTTIVKRAGGHQQLWVTEFGYPSNPPNPGAVSLATQARWLEQAFYAFWSQGVNTAVWYLIRDPTPGYDQDYSGEYDGLYFYGGTPKPALQAYNFPFVVLPGTGGKVNAWGIAPRSGSLVVQRQKGRSWKTLFRLHVSGGNTFVRTVAPSLRGKFRAVVAGQTSLVWSR